MRTLRSVVALTVVLALVASVRAGQASGKKGKNKGERPAHGVVIAVQKDKDKDTGTITVLVHRGKKGDPDAEKVEKKFAVSEATRFEKVLGKKGDRERKPATFAEVHKGDHVRIRAAGDAAEMVLILEHKKDKEDKE
jgi:hypothetical protein